MIEPQPGRSAKGFAIGILALLVIHALFLQIVVEDAYISLRFAKHLAAGLGLIWNAGEPPVEAYTNLLWVLLSAGAMKLGLDGPLMTQILGGAASLGVMAYTYRYARRLLGLDRELALLPLLLLAVSGPFATWALSGLETNLFALLVLGACYHLVTFWKTGRTRQAALASALGLLATLTRPDGLGIFAILIGLHLVGPRAGRAKSSPLRTTLAIAACFLFPMALYGLWKLRYFGDLIPNTFYAKTGGTLEQWIRGVTYTLYFAIQFLLPLLPFAALALWARRWGVASSAGEPMVRLARVVGIAVSLGYTGYVVLVGGDYMAMYRFFVPILPLLYLGVADGLRGAAAAAANTPGVRRAFALATLVACGATLANSTPLDSRLYPQSRVTHGQYRGVRVERWHTHRLEAIGRFFRSYRRRPNESVATSAAGAVAYFSELRVYEFFGLLDPVMSRKRVRGMGKGFPGHEKEDVPYVLIQKRPDYVMFSRMFTPAPSDTHPGSDPVANAIIAREYEVLSEWVEDRGNRESGYFTFMRRRSSGGR